MVKNLRRGNWHFISDAGNTRSSVTGLSNRNHVHKPVLATLLLSCFHRVIPPYVPTPSSSSGKLRVLHSAT
jgi:hypothetical protein